MKLYSTNNPSLRVEFKDAVINSLPADKGLYMPVNIPVLDSHFLRNIDQYSMPGIAFKIAATLLGDSIPECSLRSIINDAINFPAPVVKLDDQTHVLELFHGPSLAFKDFGARFMSRVMSYFLQDGNQILDVLVATSGDTGGAVAAGFLGVPNTRVTILYPKGKVSGVQQMQLTTHGENIHAIEIDGTFDDCQALVKAAFLDPVLSQRFRLTSANSINIVRLIPQTFYYFNAYAQLKQQGISEVVFSVPSGNFGNMAAGLLAWKMGLPVKQFLAATNVNDTVPEYLNTGVYAPNASVQTCANAMDVGNPSNWVRIADLFKNNMDDIKQIVKAYSFTDQQTTESIRDLFDSFGYIACPHTAIGWLAVQEWRRANPGDTASAVFLSTAHPCKFPDVIPEDLIQSMDIPDQVKALSSGKSSYSSLKTDFAGFKAHLLKEYA
jgi:threonine synthase